MNRLQSCLRAQIFIFLCLSATNAATESILNSTSNVSTTSGEAFSPPTPPAGGAAVPDPTSVATTEAVSLSSPEATKMEETETPGVFTETPPAPTAQPVVPAEGNRFQLPLSISFLSPSPEYRSAPLLAVSTCNITHLASMTIKTLV